MYRPSFTVIVFCFLSLMLLHRVNAQEATVSDTTASITAYEKYNVMLGGDSIRYCDGLPCNGWVRDYHKNGELKHRGFYVDGQLASVYRNYYSNGQLERDFRVRNHRRSQMTVYYKSGMLLSEVTYDYDTPIEWTDYYSNGQKEYTEKLHRKGDYLIHRKFFAADGTPQSSTILTNRRRLLYDRKEYHENGQIERKGRLSYNTAVRDYQKTGLWQIFDKDGVLIKEETYYRGRVIDDSE